MWVLKTQNQEHEVTLETPQLIQPWLSTWRLSTWWACPWGWWSRSGHCFQLQQRGMHFIRLGKLVADAFSGVKWWLNTFCNPPRVLSDSDLLAVHLNNGVASHYSQWQLVLVEGGGEERFGSRTLWASIRGGRRQSTFIFLTSLFSSSSPVSGNS